MSDAMQCKGCAAVLPENARFCPRCGKAVEETPTAETKTCAKCGTSNPVAARFCKRDGFPFAAATNGASAPQPGETVQPAAEGVACPRCGVSYPSTVKFCRKDGTPLGVPAADQTPESAEPSAAPPPGEMPALEAHAPLGSESASDPRSGDGFPPEGPPLEVSEEGETGAHQASPQYEARAETGSLPIRRTKPRIAIAALAVLGVAVAAFSFTLRSTPASTQDAIKRELSGKGIAGIDVRVNEEWTVTLSGTAERRQDKDAALAMARQQPKVRDVVDSITLAPQVDESGGQPAKGGDGAGPSEFKDAAGSDQSAAGTGDVVRAEQSGRAGRIASGIPGSASADKQVPVRPPAPSKRDTVTSDQTSSSPEVDVSRAQPSADTVASEQDPARLEGEINRALRKAGLGSVTSAVSDEFRVVLKGSVGSSEEKEQAFSIASGFPAVRKVKDLVFIVQQH